MTWSAASSTLRIWAVVVAMTCSGVFTDALLSRALCFGGLKMCVSSGLSSSGKMPWQKLNLPVYSISSEGKEGKTMNIATYVSTASLPRPDQPPMYTVALFKTSREHPLHR